MYQLTVTVNETIGCYICRAVISSVDQWDRVVTIATTGPTYLELDPAFLEDDLLQVLQICERFVRSKIDTPIS